MFYENLAVVIAFLGALFLLKIYLQRKREKNGAFEGDFRKLSVTARLNLSNSSHADVLNVGKESFLVVFSKSTQPAIVKLEDITNFAKEEIK